MLNDHKIAKVFSCELDDVIRRSAADWLIPAITKRSFRIVEESAFVLGASQ